MPTNWTSYDVDRAVFENFARLQGCAANDHIAKSRLWSESDQFSKYGPYDASWERPKPWTADQTAQLEHQLHMRLRKRRREEYCIFHRATRHSTSACPYLVRGDMSTAEIVSELRRHEHCLCCLEKHVGLINCGGRCLEPDCSNPDTHHVRLHWAFVDKPPVRYDVERSNVNERTASCPPARAKRLTSDCGSVSAHGPTPTPDYKSKCRPRKLKKAPPTSVQFSLPVLSEEAEEQRTPLPAMSESRFVPQPAPSEEPTSPDPDLSEDQSAHLSELSDQQYSPLCVPSERQSSSQLDLSEEQLSSGIELAEEQHPTPRSDLLDEQSECEYLAKRTVDSDPSALSVDVERHLAKVGLQPEITQPEAESTVTAAFQSSARPDPTDVESTAVKNQSGTQPASTADGEQLDKLEVEPSAPPLEPTTAEEPSPPSAPPEPHVREVPSSSGPDPAPIVDNQSTCPTQPAVNRDPSVSPVGHAVGLRQSTHSHLAPERSSPPVPTHAPTAMAESGLAARSTENQPQHNTTPTPKNSPIAEVPWIGIDERIARSVETFVRASEDFWHLKSETLILRLFRIGASYSPP